MDIQVKSSDFQRFIKRCYCNNLIPDLVIQADDKGLHARFSTKEKSMYGEVYLSNVTVKTAGTIKIPRLKQLLQSVDRINSDVIRIVTQETPEGNAEYCITDGTGVGKVRTKMLQTDDGSVVESYDSLPDEPSFNAETLEYNPINGKYENGCKVEYAKLTEILKDAKAFGYETYRFYTKLGKKKDVKSQTFLKCAIVNEHTSETFDRTIADSNFIGDPEKIPEVYIGAGFKEIIASLVGTVDKDTGENKETPVNVSLYFDEISVLITDGKTFYFNLHTLE